MLRFYRQQHYSARFIGYDKCYVIWHQQEIVASVIISNIHPDNPHALLHALVTNKAFYHQGLASKLIKHALEQTPSMICFANTSLSPFYLKNQFTIANQRQQTEVLNPYLLPRFNSYQKKQPHLQLFISNNTINNISGE